MRTAADTARRQKLAVLTVLVLAAAAAYLLYEVNFPTPGCSAMP